jgi:hypothetical protein
MPKGKPNTGIVLNPEKPKYSRGKQLNHAQLRRILDHIDVGVHPSVAASAEGWLPDEFEELVGRNEKFRRLLLKHFARYEVKRATQVDAGTDPKTAILYLERCRKTWSQKVDVNVRTYAKKAFARIEKELLEERKTKLISGEEAYDLVLMCFNAEGAEAVFE